MKAILRLEKIKNYNHLRAATMHNLRLTKSPNVDESRSVFNIIDLAKSYKDLKNSLSLKFNKNNIKPRSDSVKAVEVVLTASPEFFKNKTSEEIANWATANRLWAGEEFGEGNLLQFCLHLDEKTPHIHLIFTPITKDGRLSMKELYGGRAKLSALQTRYANEMAQFKLKRGFKNSKTKHQNLKKFYSLVENFEKLKPSQKFKIKNEIDELAKLNELEQAQKINEELDQFFNFKL